ncbi:MAG: T9SS type A sorting domain-containing protein, partial [Prolixibacteraceae bacterium]|nr:T9SS type A sorting domain-containing protein [Prolixibacteraceae bacterium]MBN2775733.1 T9SS type A sorting domain-containing protein [Prolixibacteraceae bacterium]
DAQDDAKISAPFNYGAFDFQPLPNSPVFNASYWAVTPVIEFELADQELDLRNYPNPFSDYTNIELSLTEKSFVKIQVYNISGKMVSEIYNGDLYKGTHKFEFNADGMPNGLYFTKVLADNKSQTLKMLLNK